jgi:nucleotide-binding universal stress UspA family protein
MYSKILVPIDGSETSAAGLDEAIKLAKFLGSQVCLLHIVNEFVMDSAFAPAQYSSELLELMRKGGQAILDAAESTVQRQGIKPTCVLLESIGGVAADSIIEQAKNFHAELIVMGTHGRRGIFRLAMGSDAEQVLRASSIPVLLVRGQAAAKKAAVAATQIQAAAA